MFGTEGDGPPLGDIKPMGGGGTWEGLDLKNTIAEW